MKNIREAVHDVIEHRVLPWIERDGISKLFLPEQITPDDCVKEPKCNRPRVAGHYEHDIVICLAGRLPYYIEEKTFVFTPGKIMLLPGETVHTAVQKKWWRVANLDLSQPDTLLWFMVYPFGVRVQASHAMVKDDGIEVTKPYMLLDRHFSRLVSDLLEEVRSRPPRYEGVGKCFLTEFMERCLRATAVEPAVDIVFIPPRRRAHPHNLAESGSRRTTARRKRKGKSAKAASKQHSARIQAARDFIHANYHIPITLDDIAAAAHISVDYFGRQFKAAVGVTPIQYLLNVRMEAARELILTDLKVSDVARMVGIEDQYYFSRVFSGANGLSPLQYRRKMAKVSDLPPPTRK